MIAIAAGFAYGFTRALVIALGALYHARWKRDDEPLLGLADRSRPLCVAVATAAAVIVTLH